MPGSTGGDPGAVARLLLERCLATPPRLAGGRLACLDGPAGSGKSTLAHTMVARAAGTGTTVRLLHMDDLYEGWAGLGRVADRLQDDVVAPLAAGGSGRYPRWDWLRGAWAEEHEVGPVDLLVLEGVGSGTPRLAAWRSLLAWVDAPAPLRRARWVERDGARQAARFWDAWAASEAGVFARDRAEERADVLVDGTGEREPLER